MTSQPVPLNPKPPYTVTVVVTVILLGSNFQWSRVHKRIVLRGQSSTQSCPMLEKKDLSPFKSRRREGTGYIVTKQEEPLHPILQAQPK